MAEKASAELLHRRSPSAPTSRTYRVSDAGGEGARHADDRLGPARGILIAIAIVLPFWLLVGLIATRFLS